MPKVRAPGVEELVLRYAVTVPEWGQFTVANALREEGVEISASGVRTIWKRHNLETLLKRVVAISSGDPREDTLASPPNARRQAHVARVRRRQFLQRDTSENARGERWGTRELLLDVAADEFRCHGYKGAVLKEIASKAGILPGSLYHYFRSKEDLLTQVHHASFTELNLAVDAALKGLTDPTERLRAACRKHLELLLSGNPLSRFAGVRLFVPTDGPLNARMIGDRDAYEKRFRRLVTAVPLPPRVDPSLLRLGLLGALNWSQVWYKPGQKSPGAIADELVGIFIGAAHERPGEAAARPATDGRARAKRSSARR